ncbi:MAG: CaiB/BaiF CoA transferase family protein, partial [Nannocystaceae bacterium]
MTAATPSGGGPSPSGDGAPPKGPLAGMRVLEMGQLIAGPFCGAMLAGFGAEVFKVEPPGQGDPLRNWRLLHEGTSVWWRQMARNKKSVVVDLRREEGQALIRDCVARRGVDVIIENFRPGRMAAWGLGYEELRALNPSLIMASVSGWGQDGPRARLPGFANVAESVAGLRYLTGEPDRPPVRSSVSLGDSIAGLHAAFGVLAAVHHREQTEGRPGQLVDVSLAETIFNMLEGILPEYDVFGVIRERSGARLPGVAPTNTYPCAGEGWVVIGANSDAMFRRLMIEIGREDLADAPDLQTNAGRVRRCEELDEAIADWTRRRTVEEVVAALDGCEVAVGPIQDIAQIARDPQFAARDFFERHHLEDGTALRMPGWVPRLSESPASTNWLGPTLGAHTEEFVRAVAGRSSEGL